MSAVRVVLARAMGEHRAKDEDSFHEIKRSCELITPLRRRIVMDVERVEGATMDYTKLTLAELRNGISDTKSAIHRCKEALDNLRQPKTVGLQAMADAITHLLPRLEQDLKALEKAYIAKSVSRG